MPPRGPSRALTIKLFELGPLLDRYIDEVYAGQPVPQLGTLIRHFAIVGIMAEVKANLPAAVGKRILAPL